VAVHREQAVSALALEAAQQATGHGLVHYFCLFHDHRRGLCGAPLTAPAYLGATDADCVVCLDLGDAPCTLTCGTP
jgi:hypothetical protein